MINIVLNILIALVCVFTFVTTGSAQTINQKAMTTVSRSEKDKLDKKTKIFQFIKLVQPKFSNSYISRVVNAIFKYGDKYDVDPYVIASTAYVESEFNMKSKPCIGVMQLLKSTARVFDPKRNYNPYELEGNIAIGTLELKHHLNINTPRGKLPDRSTYRKTYEKYNGSYMKRSYARKVLLVQIRLEQLALDKIKEKLRKGPIWNL